MRFPMVQPVTDMTRAALGPRLAPGADEYLDMFHDDAVFEFPRARRSQARRASRRARCGLASVWCYPWSRPQLPLEAASDVADRHPDRRRTGARGEAGRSPGTRASLRSSSRRPTSPHGGTRAPEVVRREPGFAVPREARRARVVGLEDGEHVRPARTRSCARSSFPDPCFLDVR